MDRRRIFQTAWFAMFFFALITILLFHRILRYFLLARKRVCPRFDDKRTKLGANALSWPLLIPAILLLEIKLIINGDLISRVKDWQGWEFAYRFFQWFARFCERKSDGSDSLLGIKKGKAVKNCQKLWKIWILFERIAVFESESLESRTNRSRSLFNMSDFEQKNEFPTLQTGNHLSGNWRELAW